MQSSPGRSLHAADSSQTHTLFSGHWTVHLGCGGLVSAREDTLDLELSRSAFAQPHRDLIRSKSKLG